MVKVKSGTNSIEFDKKRIRTIDGHFHRIKTKTTVENSAQSKRIDIKRKSGVYSIESN